MKFLDALVASGLFATLSSASTAPVYTFGGPEKSPRDGEVPTLSPANARLFFAERLRLSQYHDLKDADDATLHLLNNERIVQTQLFTSHETRGAVRALIIIENAEDPKAFLNPGDEPVFAIEDVPTTLSNRALLDSFITQDRQQRQATKRPLLDLYISKDDNIDNTFGLEDNAMSILPLVRAIRRQELEDYDDTLVILQIGDEQNTANTPLVGSLKSALFDRLRNSGNGIESTVVFVPASKNGGTKRRSSWGNFVEPKIGPRQVQEAPLSEGATINTHEAVASTFPMVSLDKNSTSLPKTTLPQCHRSENVCNTATASCSGHGKCKKKFTERVSENEEGAECWACACTPTVIEQGGRRNTTYWGGPACQKKDVSTPFFLLAGFTIAIVSALTWGIGLLYSIGQDELPSVLGAGVAGPQARK